MTAQDTSEQTLGREAEARFALAVTTKGHLWHPAANGNDFGIDGRIEVLHGGQVTGLECGAQIKASRRMPLTAGKIRLKKIAATTAGYWLSRVTPVLIVFYCEEMMYWAWADEAVPDTRLREALAHGRKTLYACVDPTRRLNSKAWTTIESHLEEHADAVGRLLSNVNQDHAIRELYFRTTDTMDLLVDFVSWLAFAPTTDLSATLEKPIGSAELSPPKMLEDGQGFLTLIWLHESLAWVLNNFLVEAAAAGNSAEHPIMRAVGATLLVLMSHSARIYDREHDREQSSDRMGWRLANIKELVTCSGLTLVTLRDFNRDLRRWLFPGADEATNEGSARIRDLTSMFVTPLARWTAGR